MCHVLIIEDEVLVAMHLEAVLQDVGATSFSYADCESGAVETARATPPDLITSDVHLREGSGPLAVAAILKEHGPCPVLFITAHPESCIPCDPPARIFGKPFSEEAIVATFLELAPPPGG